MWLNFILGIVFTLLLLYIVYLRGKLATQAAQLRVIVAEDAARATKYQALAAKVQELVKPYEIRIGPNEVTNLANVILERIEQIFATRDANALNKLN